MMVGKAVDSSIATYIRGANLRTEAKKVLNVLRMEEMQASGVDNSTLGFLVVKSNEEVLREYIES
jgi:hypothetical protein